MIIPNPRSMRLLRPSGLRLLIALALAAPIAGCDDPLAPFQPEVANVADNFQFQATGVQARTLTRTYDWPNSGTRATVNHSTTTTGGSQRLVIRDAAGTTVYDAALVPSLTVPTAVGVAGTWRIELRLVDYSGTINFRVQTL